MNYTFVVASERIVLETVDNVHVPSVDSLLLANHIPSGTSIAADVGCGAGLLSVVLAKRGWQSVIATDIVPEAVSLTNRNAQANGVSGRVSAKEADLFVDAAHRYDLIVCNPPGRPSRNETALPPAHRSGLDGSTFIVKFFERARDHLLPDGKILSTHSSLISFQTTRARLEALGFSVRVVDELIVPFRVGYFLEYDYLLELTKAGYSEVQWHSGVPLEVVRVIELSIRGR